MISELKRLLSNSYSPYDTKCFASIVVMKDGSKFSGVTVKNAIFRDGIYAEQIAIGRAVANGYKYGDFDKIYIMVGTKNISDLKYLNERVITEFFEPVKSVILYTIDEDTRVLKVGNLYNNIY
ncbi:MAG: cytidine deaminase [Bacilli bacterium]|nr:cytidine deaminase [Bacilli bacterium]